MIRGHLKSDPARQVSPHHRFISMSKYNFVHKQCISDMLTDVLFSQVYCIVVETYAISITRVVQVYCIVVETYAISITRVVQASHPGLA